ncbi:MAG: LLM class flavin-dependent oxidoreductase [Hyphomicrobiaceae bacterium]|nr:LLM class flavin-dependent oxidoreductase [Hyphomicrobiaceae bacterium]
MPREMPAISLVAVPGRRRATIEAAKEIDQRGFAGIWSPSIFSNMALCEALALETKSIPFATSIAPIYMRTVGDFAQSAAFIHEVSAGRFRLGVGVSHAPAHVRMGVTPGKPLADMRSFVERYRTSEGLGTLPPVVLAALRTQMVRLAGEIGDGVVFANAARSHMGASLSALSEAKRKDTAFSIANMIPTCISDDIEAAKAVNRRTLTSYGMLPNYRNYWKEAGYVEEMEAIENAIAEGRKEDVPKCFSDKWLADTTLFGPRSKVIEGVEAWRAAGVRTPIVVPSSAAGNQMQAIAEVVAAFTA